MLILIIKNIYLKDEKSILMLKYSLKSWKILNLFNIFFYKFKYIKLYNFKTCFIAISYKIKNIFKIAILKITIKNRIIINIFFLLFFSFKSFYQYFNIIFIKNLYNI